MAVEHTDRSTGCPNSPFPPKTWMSTCSNRYMTKVFTCGSRPTKNMMGKHSVNTAERGREIERGKERLL